MPSRAAAPALAAIRFSSDSAVQTASRPRARFSFGIVSRLSAALI
jgi:hypothetical protein